MSNILDVAENREKCQKFTPANMVEVMLDMIGYNDNLVGKKVLESSFGIGSILIPIVRRYIADGIAQKMPLCDIAKHLEEDIIGIERDKCLFARCKRTLDKVAAKYDLPKIKWNIHNTDALKWSYNCKFDFIIGNPPYISYKSIDENNRKILKEKFKSCELGKFDYCYAFIEQGIKLLNETGKMVQLVPSNIFKNVFAENLRRLLLTHIAVIYEYPSQNIFESTLTSTSIFLYDKTYAVDRINYKNVTNNIEYLIKRNQLASKWMFLETTVSSGKEVRFGDLFKASIAVATLYNKAFVLDKKTINEYQLETQIIRPAASPRSLRYKREEFIIFPYFYKESELVRIEPEDFTLQFPAIEKYLRQYSNALETRDSDKSCRWYEYGRSQALAHLNSEKLLMSTIITDKVGVYSLNAETIPYSGIYITSLSDCPLQYAIDILKSESFMKYVRNIGIAVSGTSIRITCKDINNFKFVRGAI